MNDLAIHPLQGIELFSGVGMLGEGLRAGLDYLGFSYRTACHVEREAYPGSVMVARMEEGSMDAAPEWSDVCTFDARAWRGKVDCVVAGFPCQDLSVAGKRAGLDGKRSGLFFEVTRIADDSGAWLIFLENVAGIASATATVMDEEEGELDERAAARVLGELADLGWDAEWITLSASDVGASHGRARWFCIAWRMANSEHDRSRAFGSSEQRRRPDSPTGRSEQMADTTRHVGHASERQGGRGRRVCEAGNELADSAMFGREARPGIDGAETALVGAGFGEFGIVDQRGAMADTECSTVRWDSGTASCAQSEDGRRCANDDHGTECVCRFVAQSESLGRNQGRTESGREQGRSDAAECCMPVADAGNPRLQGHEQQSAYEQDGRTDGRSRNHADQLPNFIMMNFSHPGQQTPDGDQSSPPNLGERRHLNPLFGASLMGWPLTWVIAEPHASSALATELWRYALRSQLSNFFGDPGL